MTPFSKTRRHRRFAVDVKDIVARAAFATEVVIHNISITGVSLLTDRKLEVGRQYSLRILEGDPDMDIWGTVIWCGENDAAGGPSEDAHLRYAAGIQFATLQQDTVQRLVSFIESHLIEKHTQVKVHGMSGFRCNIRFRLDRQEMATLDIDETYRVRKLSLGGMLFESRRSFEPETRLHMEMTIPGNIPVDFIGRVTTCIPSERPACFDTGIEFIDMPEPDRIKLKEFIRRLYLEDAGFPVQ
jgi:hypothetical protein